MISWLKALLSADKATSSSRLVQILVVVAMTALIWVVVWKSAWIISDNARLIALCLIGGGAGGYIASKVKEGNDA
jgi:hypothetical protein